MTTHHPLCAVDQRPVHDGSRLCSACWADLRKDLAELPELLHDLDRQLAGLTRTGGSPIGIVVRTAERGLGFDERAGDLLRELHNTLGGWVRVLCEDNGLPVDMRDETAVLGEWLGQHEAEIRRHEAAGELWTEVHGLVERARQVVDQHRADRVYVGQCSAILTTDVVLGEDGIDRCWADLYAIEGRATITCRACGAEHDAAERRRTLLDSVDDQLATAAEISKAIAEYDGQEVTVERIRKWYSRGRIAQHPPRKGERWPRYRVGDVRDLLAAGRVQQRVS